MAFVIGYHPVLISSKARLWTNRNSAAVFVIRHNGYFHKTVISHSQLHYGRHADGNKKLSLLMYYFGTEHWHGIVLSGRLKAF